jgi:hypothetical protein
MSQPFGIVVRSISIPARMGPGVAGAPDSVEPEPCDGGFTFRIGNRSYQYTRYGLEQFDD